MAPTAPRSPEEIKVNIFVELVDSSSPEKKHQTMCERTAQAQKINNEKEVRK